MLRWHIQFCSFKKYGDIFGYNKTVFIIRIISICLFCNFLNGFCRNCGILLPNVRLTSSMSKMSGEVDVSRLLLACICSATKSGTSSATCALLSKAWLIALLLSFALASVSSSVSSVAGSVALSAASAASRAAISALEGRPLLRLGGAIIASGWASSSAFSEVCFLPTQPPQHRSRRFWPE